MYTMCVCPSGGQRAVAVVAGANQGRQRVDTGAAARVLLRVFERDGHCEHGRYKYGCYTKMRLECG